MYTKDQIDLAIKEVGLSEMPDTIEELYNYIKSKQSSSELNNELETYSAAFDESVFILKQQLTLNENWFNSPESFTAFKIQRKEKYDLAKTDCTIDTLEGPVKYNAGFYILTGPKGERYPISPEKFKELKDDLGDGVCQSKKILKKARLANHDGQVKTGWGETLSYKKGIDYLIRHGEADYGVVKADIFKITYGRED